MNQASQAITFSTEAIQKAITDLQAQMKEHEQTAPNHKGNIVNYTITSHPFSKTAKCSYCNTHLEVRLDNRK